MDALAFLDLKKPPEPQPVYVITGEERLLKSLVRRRLRDLILGRDADELAYRTFAGETAALAAVNDELLTRPFLSPRKLVVVEDADAFVSAHREKLERYVEKPSPVGHLVLEVKSWKSNTRLAKVIPAGATFACERPKPQALKSWLMRWAQDQHGQKLEPAAADLLIEMVGAEMGMLEQELAKLAVFVGKQQPITVKAVDALVGQSRLETAWVMLDQLSAGQLGQALETLHQLLRQGEDVHKLLGAISWQLRKLAQVARLRQLGVPLHEAMSRVSLPPFKRDAIQSALGRFGPQVFDFYDLLLQTDASLRTSDRLTDAALLERLLIQLSRPAKAMANA
jgi:DNA polymerase-3 subunit delta